MRLSYEQMLSIGDAVPALLTYVDAGFCHRMCNLAYANWFNQARETVIGRSVQEVAGEAVWQAMRPQLEAALTGESREWEMEVSDRRGETRRMHIVHLPQRERDGTVAGVVVMLTDVTARTQTETELRQSEERYRSLFEAIDEGFCVIEMLFDAKQRPVDYRFVEVNPAFELQAGMPGATGRRMLEFVDHIESHWLENYGRVAVTGEPIRFAAEYESLGRWFDVYAFRVGEPEARRVAVLFNNITQRKRSEIALRESEARFRNMSDHSPMMLWVTDADGRCVHLNQRWFEFTGQTPESGLGFGWLEAVHPEDRPEADRLFRESNARRAPLRVEYRLRRHDGTYHWAIDAAHPRFSDAGEYLGYIGSVVDIQKRKEAEEALREAKERAERASRAKDDFLAQLSHELRTPLTPVLMTAEALREDPALPVAAREQLDMIARNVALEARLIDDLLDLTRITHGKLALRAEPCDVHALLRLVVEIVREEARKKRIALALEAGARCSRLTGDPARLQQVFWNLLRNAVKFAPEDGHVRIRTTDAEATPGGEAGRRLCIAVSDDGIGFAPGAAEGLFKPFERGAAGTDQRFPGLGLGLVIARAIVDLHGGVIRAESAGEGRGATFTVELPGARPASAVAESAGNGDSAAAGEPALRLLIVEDHAPTLDVLSRLLRRKGHRVTTAGSVAAALAAADQETFDAVLSDLGLPDGTGLQLMEELRARHGLRGIALSGYGMEEDRRRSAEAGFVAHLIKPVDINEVRRTLRQFAATGE